MDIYSKSNRSKIMSKISGNETKPEIMVRKYLFSHGFRFLKNDKRYPGKPDIVLPKHRTIVFIHGCFWHGHDCKAGKLPETNTDFWRKKIKDNIERDQRNQDNLSNLGWNVIVVWQCELRNLISKEKRLQSLIKEIRKL